MDVLEVGTRLIRLKLQFSDIKAISVGGVGYEDILKIELVDRLAFEFKETKLVDPISKQQVGMVPEISELFLAKQIKLPP